MVCSAAVPLLRGSGTEGLGHGLRTIQQAIWRAMPGPVHSSGALDMGEEMPCGVVNWLG